MAREDPFLGTYIEPFTVQLQACLSMGWDVISPEECCLSSRLWRKLFVEAGKKGAGLRVDLRRGEVLHVKDQPCRRFQIVLEVGFRGPLF